MNDLHIDKALNDRFKAILALLSPANIEDLKIIRANAQANYEKLTAQEHHEDAEGLSHGLFTLDCILEPDLYAV